MNWPGDADGDVMRRLRKKNFDFDREVEIDFNIDFESWPPTDEAMNVLAKIPNARMASCEDDQYVLLQITARVAYDFVLSMQAELTEAAKPFGGWCDSWGVWSN